MPTHRAPVLLVAVAVGALLAACASPSASSGITAPSSAVTANSAITGNGIERYTANEIVDKVRVAVTIASSVHVRGMVTTTGQRQVDYDVLVSLPSGVATLTEGGVAFEVIRAGDFLYIKGDRAYWMQLGGNAAVTLMNGKYLRAPIADPQFGTYDSYFKLATWIPSANPRLVKGDITTVNGVRVLAIVDADPQQGGTLHVAMQGPAYPILLEAANGGARLEFTDYDKPVSIQAPPQAQFVDLSELKSKLG